MKKPKFNLQKEEEPFIRNYMTMDETELIQALNTPGSLEQHIWFAFTIITMGKTREECFLKRDEFIDLNKNVQEFIGISMLLLKRINSDFLEDMKDKIPHVRYPTERE